ncbi:hypothetical protein V5N11_022286 [Cardamine amara subsp. amara]|uniref:RNase H type-1 domain-containing protein n=1 Tax=Cardamine amara subsp. amara TaxID=228776 RepID=A0ABD1B7C2_CARAN
MECNTIGANYRQAIPWLLWGIWKQRNVKVYAGNTWDKDILIAHALEESEQWYKANEEEEVHKSQGLVANGGGEKKWSRPPRDILKCNIHASWLNSNSRCGGAWIVRDNRGDVMFHARDAFVPTSNRIAAELRCLIWAMKSVLDLRVTCVEFWTENLSGF